MTFEQFIDIADVLLCSDAESFDVNVWEKDLYEELMEDVKVDSPKFIKYKLDEDKIDRIIEKLKISTFYITDYWKTKQFLKKHNLEKEDLEYVISSLTKEDYKVNSISEYNEAIIFVTKSKIKELGPFKLYIKLDYDTIENSPVIVISFHE